eukprot:1196215-Prorocentrum_minimum.AAC.4
MANEKENSSQASSSGAGSSQQGAQQGQGRQTVQVFGSDLYSTAFILVLLLMGFLKVSLSPNSAAICDYLCMLPYI